MYPRVQDVVHECLPLNWKENNRLPTYFCHSLPGDRGVCVIKSLSNDNILDRPKFKAFADNKMYVAENWKNLKLAHQVKG